MSVPEKPSLDGLEAKWDEWWEAAGTYHFDRSKTRDAGLRDRHAAAHGERVAAHRPRDVVHAHRPRGALPAHARRRGLLPDGLGRQRPAHRAPRAELLRRPLRSVAAGRPRVRRLEAGAPRRRPGRGQPAELHRALRAPHHRGREGVRGVVPAAGALGRLAPDLHDDRRGLPSRVAARVPAARAQRARLHGRGAHDVGRRLPHRGRAGRDRGPRGRGHLPSGRVRPRGRRRPGRDRDVAPGADPGLRRPRREPRRRAVRASGRGRPRSRRCSACRCRWSRTSSPIPRRAPARRRSARSATSPTSSGGATSGLPARVVVRRDGTLAGGRFGEPGWESRDPDAANARDGASSRARARSRRGSRSSSCSATAAGSSASRSRCSTS